MPHQNSKILIIEDEMLIAHTIKKMVDKHFNCIGIAKNYEEAVPFLNLSDVDVVLIDITLSGGKSGIDIANVLNKDYQIPFIFITALTDTETLQKIIAVKPSAYLAKPIQEPNLVTAINLALLTEKEKILTLELGKKRYSINIKDFVYAQADGVYITLFFKNDSPIILRASFPNLEVHLPETHFKRINRSEAVNPKQVTQKTTTTILIGEKMFKISNKFSL